MTLKGSSTVPILGRQLPPSLPVLATTLPTQGPGSSPLLETGHPLMAWRG